MTNAECHVLEADPPWPFSDSLPGPKRGADAHYGLLSIADIKAFPIPTMASPSVLFLWRVASMQPEALDVAKAWGFTVKSELVWVKRTSTGGRHFGMGRIVRAEHETCLIATRGKGLEVAVKNVRSTFEAPVGRHSEKPAKFYEIVEELFPLATTGLHVRLFARDRRAGWLSLGNELEAAQ